MKYHGTDGKPSFDRGKPPHKGGAHAAKNKAAGKRKIFFTKTIIVNNKVKEVRCQTSWKPGKSRKKFNK